MSNHSIDRHGQRTSSATRGARPAGMSRPCTGCTRGHQQRVTRPAGAAHQGGEQDQCIADLIARAIADNPSQLYRGGA